MQPIVFRLIRGIMLLPATAALSAQRSMLDFRGQRLLLEE